MKTFYHYDGQLSTRQLSDDNSQVTDTYTYDAFGLLLNRSGATENNYMYTGEQYDPNVGFYYLRARYYNQELGRFTTVDLWKGSIYDPVSLHQYLYCGNDPVDFVDWSGELKFCTSIMELQLTQTITAYFRSQEFQVRFKTMMAISNIFGLTIKSILPKPILQLKVEAFGITLTVDQWLTAYTIMSGAASLQVGLTLAVYANQIASMSVAVLAAIFSASGVVSLSELPEFISDIQNKHIKDKLLKE